ncbi:MAG: agmatinase [Thermoproteota archaeon]
MKRDDDSRFLHTYRSLSFLETQTNFDRSEFVLLGAPLDLTGTFRQGYRFAPNSIRSASVGLEYFSPRANRELFDLKIADIGDMELSMELGEALKQIEETVEEVVSRGKKVIIFGGEHTVSLPCLTATKPDVLILFDAHLDSRDSYKDLKVSHATWLRRALESKSVKKVLHIGSRAYSKEEIDYTSDKIIALKSLEIIKGNNRDIKSTISEGESCWISFDMDVFDPAFAPAVGNPEPEGLSPTHVLDLMQDVSGGNLVGFDITELVPGYDHGQTSLLASKIAVELLAVTTKAL